MSAAAQLTRRATALRREPWGVRPEFRADGTPYPRNTHVPRYCAHAQDPLARRPNVRALQSVFWEKGKPVQTNPKYKQADRILTAGYGELCVWVGDFVNAANPGQSVLAADPVPRSSLIYWAECLKDLCMIEEYDTITGGRAAPRHRADGRGRKTWRVRSFDHALDLLAADPNVATPKNRTFWTLDGRPMSTAEVVAWKLDAAVAERMPDAWENNARFYNPYAPMKPLRRTERLMQANAEEIAAIHKELLDWQIAATTKQAAEILGWAREKYEIPAAALIGEMREAIDKQRAADYKARRRSIFNIHFFHRIRVQGLAELWKRNHDAELLRNAEAQQAAVLADRATRNWRASDADPPD